MVPHLRTHGEDGRNRLVERSVRKLEKVTKRSGRNADSGKTTSA